MRFKIPVILFILIWLPLNISAEKMGRVFEKGNTLTPDLIKKLQSKKQDYESSKINLFYFSKSGQDYSKNMKNEIIEEFGDHHNLFNIWEFCTNKSEIANPSYWTTIQDTNFNYYKEFGVKVFPTLFVFSPDFSLQGYISGWSPEFNKKLVGNFTFFYPKLFKIKTEFIQLSPEEKSRLRKETLIETLYKKEQYSIALMQINTIDSLSDKGKILLGKIYLHTDNNAEAIKLYSEIKEETPGIAALGYGIACFQSNKYEQALEILGEIKTIHEMYKVHYWKAKCYDKLGDESKALREYKRSFRQVIISAHLEMI